MLLNLISLLSLIWEIRQLDKIQLRRQMIQLRYQMSDSQFNNYNSLIISHLENMEAFKKASHIAIYMSYKNEADTR
ncbi:5-formyltetrahydrofolate cyclo-ligase, partial [Eggerthia catenaformis]|uniref:5-formyltetrahydrofolate cyclo-ligase n=1 Tax=Eggerthia catenaformis TaxID=31973 RepID=UPI0036F429E3